MRILTILFALASGLTALPAPAQTPDIGGVLFDQYCSGCHGETGVGDGPVAQYLTVPPANLTQLAAKNGGQFPMLQVIHVIDGRSGVRGHASQMPLFGDVFMAAGGPADPRTLQNVLDTRGKMLSLAMYLETLQK